MVEALIETLTGMGLAYTLFCCCIFWGVVLPVWAFFKIRSQQWLYAGPIGGVIMFLAIVVPVMAMAAFAGFLVDISGPRPYKVAWVGAFLGLCGGIGLWQWLGKR